MELGLPAVVMSIVSVVVNGLSLQSFLDNATRNVVPSYSPTLEPFTNLGELTNQSSSSAGSCLSIQHITLDPDRTERIEYYSSNKTENVSCDWMVHGSSNLYRTEVVLEQAWFAWSDDARFEVFSDYDGYDQLVKSCGGQANDCDNLIAYSLFGSHMTLRITARRFSAGDGFRATVRETQNYCGRRETIQLSSDTISYTFHSPGYYSPQYYADNCQRIWTFNAASNTDKLKIHFPTFNTQQRCDYVEVYDGIDSSYADCIEKCWGVGCGDVETASPTMTIVFRSDTRNPHLTRYRGFTAVVTVDKGGGISPGMVAGILLTVAAFVFFMLCVGTAVKRHGRRQSSTRISPRPPPPTDSVIFTTSGEELYMTRLHTQPPPTYRDIAYPAVPPPAYDSLSPPEYSCVAHPYAASDQANNNNVPQQQSQEHTGESVTEEIKMS